MSRTRYDPYAQSYGNAYYNKEDNYLSVDVTIPFEAKFTLFGTDPNTGVVDGQDIDEDNFGKVYFEWKDSTNPTIPTIKGAAGIVLNPASSPNWISEIQRNDTVKTIMAKQRDTIVTGTFSNYTVESAQIKLIPMYTAVLPSQMEDWSETSFREIKEKAKKKQGGIKREVVKRQVRRGGVSQPIDQRNPSITVGDQVIFGTIISRNLGDDNDGQGSGSSKIDPIYPPIPETYNGVIPYYLFFISNANQTYDTTESDIMSSTTKKVLTNIDYMKGDIRTNLFPTELASTITATKNIMTRENRIVPVTDSNISWGEYIIMADPKFVDAVTQVYEKKVTDEDTGQESTVYMATSKASIRGIITYRITLYQG